MKVSIFATITEREFTFLEKLMKNNQEGFFSMKQKTHRLDQNTNIRSTLRLPRKLLPSPKEVFALNFPETRMYKKSRQIHWIPLEKHATNLAPRRMEAESSRGVNESRSRRAGRFCTSAQFKLSFRSVWRPNHLPREGSANPRRAGHFCTSAQF